MVRSWRKDDFTCTSVALEPSRPLLYYATCAKNLYASSLPTYIAQLEPCPEESQAIERSCLAKAAVGPHAWALPPDLCRLKDHYGQAANFRSIEHAALAAKVRVYRYENDSHGVLNVLQRSRALRQAVDQAPCIGRHHIWKSRVDTNPLFVLQEAYEECVVKGHAMTRTEQAITGPGASRPHSLPTTTTIRRRFQAALSGLLRRGEQYFPERRMREKLARWHLTRPTTSSRTTGPSYARDPLYPSNPTHKQCGLIHIMEYMDNGSALSANPSLLPPVRT